MWAKLKNAAVARDSGNNKALTRPSSKLTIADIVKLTLSTERDRQNNSGETAEYILRN